MHAIYYLASPSAVWYPKPLLAPVITHTLKDSNRGREEARRSDNFGKQEFNHNTLPCIDIGWLFLNSLGTKELPRMLYVCVSCLQWMAFSGAGVNSWRTSNSSNPHGEKRGKWLGFLKFAHRPTHTNTHTLSRTSLYSFISLFTFNALALCLLKV